MELELKHPPTSLLLIGFFNEIKMAENKGHETISMKVWDWYDLLIKKYMTHCEENGD